MKEDLIEYGYLLICNYLPEQIPDDFMEKISMTDFYRMIAKARIFREMKQDDIRTAVIKAFSDESKSGGK